jgi:hypothetical protein
MTRALASLCAAALLAWALPAAAINKCVDANGKTSYQEGACPEGAKQGTLKLDPAPAPKGAAAAGPLSPEEDKEDPRMLEFVATQGTFDSCVEASPGFEKRHADTYNAWRRAHAQLVEHLSRSPRYQAVLERSRNQNREKVLRVPEGAQKLAQFCEAQFIPGLKNTLPQ